MTAPIAQQASHDYLRAAAELANAGDPVDAFICARAAQAEVEDPRTVRGEWCTCPDCGEFVAEARLRSVVGGVATISVEAAFEEVKRVLAGAFR